MSDEKKVEEPVTVDPDIVNEPDGTPKENPSG